MSNTSIKLSVNQKGFAPILVILIALVLIFFVSPFVYKAITGEFPQGFTFKRVSFDKQIATVFRSFQKDRNPEYEKGTFPPEVVEKARQVGLQARDSVVLLDIQGPKPEEEFGTGGGTGWFIDKGLVATAGHNVDTKGAKITGRMLSGDRFDLEVITSKLEPDVALLRTDYTKAPPLSLGSSKELKIGQPLVMVGHPGGIGEWIISLGPKVEKPEGQEGPALSARIPSRQGNSGSPILTLDGKVIGLVTGGGYEVNVAEPEEKAGTEVYQSFPIETHNSIEPIEVISEYVSKWRGF